MSQKRDLGPILAIAGGAVAIIAVITGFIIIGGPGDTRDRRLDEMTMQHVSSLTNGVECARRLSGEMPETPSDIIETMSLNRLASESSGCGSFLYDGERLLRGWQDLEYEVLADRKVRICADFIRPSPSPSDEMVVVDGPDVAWRYGFRELDVVRPSAGRHCYEIAIPDYGQRSTVPPPPPAMTPPN